MELKLKYNQIKLIRTILWLALLVVVLFLIWEGLAPDGKKTYIYDFSSSNYFIGKLTPGERVNPIVNNEQVIIGDPVYFNLRTLRNFDQAKLTLKFKYQNNNGEKINQPPIIEAGPLVDKTIWRYDLKPINNEYLNNLSGQWAMVQNNNLMLLQREKKYSTVDNFLNNLPDFKTIALYSYNLKNKYILSDYEPSNSIYTLDHALRGDYQFYTYIKNEDLDFKFSFSDINKNKDADPITLNLYHNDRLIDSRSLEDDGNRTDNGQTSAPRELAFKLPHPEEGVYKIELRANDDIITNSIITKQIKLAFINKIRLANSDDQSITFYTNSHELSALTTNPGKLQTIKVGGAQLTIDETYKQYTIASEDELTKIVLNKDDIVLSGNGVFGFSKEAIIEPELKKVWLNFNPDENNINYTLADYRVPTKTDGWNIANAQFDISSAYRENGKYSFLISLPGLKAEENKNQVILKEIRFDLQGKTLWDKIRY